LTPEGRERLRQAALKNRPWENSTGPRTPEGKAKVAQNGRKRQKHSISGPQLRKELAAVSEMIAQLIGYRRLLS
jgi:hypothetical protein